MFCLRIFIEDTRRVSGLPDRSLLSRYTVTLEEPKFEYVVLPTRRTRAGISTAVWGWAALSRGAIGSSGTVKDKLACCTTNSAGAMAHNSRSEATIIEDFIPFTAY